VKKDFMVLNGEKVMQERRIENDFVFKDIIIGKRIFSERIKLYSLNSIKEELEETGLNVIKVFGDYFGNVFLKNQSKRFIIIAQKN